MATVVRMPRLSPTMEEGVLLKWTKKAGDKVNPGEVIAEVETDKANMDFPLEDEGTLLKLLVAEGETVKLGAPVAVLGEPGEDADRALTEAEQSAPSSAESAAPPSPPQAAAAPAPDQRQPQTAPVIPVPSSEPPARPAPPASPPVPSASAARAPSGNGQAERGSPPHQGLRASPLARKLAYERGIDLGNVPGSGPGGRVVKRDIEAAATRPAEAAQPAPAGARGPSARPAPLPAPRPQAPAPAGTVLPISPMRRTIARRLTESKSTIPHFYVVRDVRAEALWTFHQQLKELSPDEKVTLNDVVLKATAVALTRLPEANSSWSDTGIVRHPRVDLGIAVSIEDGLVTPVLRGADQKSVGAIAREARDLIERARARRLRGDEFTGSTFSVSNMGMLGVREFTAVINPPESGILAVGTLEKRAVVESGPDGGDVVVPRRVMTLTLSADHRILDGALAARLLGEIVKVLENPLTLVL